MIRGRTEMVFNISLLSADVSQHLCHSSHQFLIHLTLLVLTLYTEASMAHGTYVKITYGASLPGNA